MLLNYQPYTQTSILTNPGQIKKYSDALVNGRHQVIIVVLYIPAKQLQDEEDPRQCLADMKIFQTSKMR